MTYSDYYEKCYTTLLAEEEWKVLYVKIHRKPCPSVVPNIKEAVS